MKRGGSCSWDGRQPSEVPALTSSLLVASEFLDDLLLDNGPGGIAELDPQIFASPHLEIDSLRRDDQG